MAFLLVIHPYIQGKIPGKVQAYFSEKGGT